MAPKSTIRKAIGVVKDQTRISIAKVASNLDPELEILIVKATTHDNCLPNDKLFDEIVHRISISKELVNECVGLISKRIERTRDWIVALKCLILVHRLMVCGGDVFMEHIACANGSDVRGCGILSNVSVFRDEAHSNSWDYTEFVRSYGMYLDEKVEMMVFNEMWIKRRSSLSDCFNELEENDKKLELDKLSDEVATKRVLSRMEDLQRLLEKVLAMRPRTVSKHQKLVVLALSPVIRESFKLYDDICECLTFLLDKFWGMEYWNVVKSLGTYVLVAKQIDELVEFYAWCKDFGVAIISEYPAVERISDDLLNTMENFMKNKANELKNGEKNKKKNDTPSKPHDEESNTSRTVELDTIPEEFVEEFQDLINLNDDDADEAPKEDQGQGLALALFSNYQGNNINPWENVSHNSEIANMTSDSETRFGGTANTDWELALVESASDLANQKTNMGGGFDNVLLESMYDQKTASNMMNANCSETIHGGNAVQALPSLVGPSQMVNQDPFAASIAVPPPVYVQIAEMEKKQQLLVQEQQAWEQQNNVVSSYYTLGPQQIMPYQNPGNLGQTGGQKYNPWSN